MKDRLVIVLYSESALFHVNRLYPRLINEFDVYLYDVNRSLHGETHYQVIHGSIYKVFNSYLPKIVVTFDCYTYLDKAIAMLARRKLVRVVYLSHGLLTNLEGQNHATLNNGLAKFGIKRIKRVFIPVVTFLYECLKVGLLKSAVRSIVRYLKDPISESLESTYLPYFKGVKGLVYCERDCEFLTKKRGFPYSEVSVVGNPDLFDLVDSEGDSANVLLLDDGLVDAGIVEEEIWLRQLSYLQQLLKIENRYLKIRLHPRSKRLESKLKALDLVVSKTSKTSLMEDLGNTGIVLGFYSSVLSVCLFNSIKVVRPDFLFPNAEIPLHQLDSLIVRAEHIKDVLRSRNEPKIERKNILYFTGNHVNNFAEKVLKHIKECEY